ncbi:hypothetical protein Pfo_031392 [Paulownia fortunei]|nr:hypothetical protein Pfo_031392 [Paulownia fortunei]
MAEDDDDETFGEFASASFQSNSQFNGPNSLADNEDDEWGDFVKSPQQSKPSDPSFKGNYPSDNTVSPPPWVKPSGALPLSIFGDPEEEEVDNFGVAGDFNRGKSSGTAGDFNSTLVHNDVSNPQNLSIADLYNRYSQIKPENGPGSNSTGSADSVENGVYSSSNQNAARSAVTELKNMDLNDTVGISDHSQLANQSDNDDFSFKLYMSDPSENADMFGGWTQDFSGFSSNLNSTKPNLQPSRSDLDMNGQKQQLDGSAIAIDDDGDDGWEFKDAYSEFRTEEVNNEVDLMANEVSERSAHSSGTGSGSNKSLDLFGTSNGSINFFTASTESVDYFTTSTGISSTSQELDFIGIQPSIATLNGFTSETNSVIEQNNIKGLLDHSTDVGSAEYDEDFGEFTAASAETGPKPGEVSTNGVLSPSKDSVSTPGGKFQEKDTQLNYQKSAIPLSIFGNIEPESGGSSDVQDVFMHQSTSDKRSSHTPTAVFSINDLISSLYSQSEQTSSITLSKNQPKLS